MDISSRIYKLGWPHVVPLKNGEDFLLFLGVIAELNPFVIVKVELLDLNHIDDLLPDSGLDSMPGEDCFFDHLFI